MSEIDTVIPQPTVLEIKGEQINVFPLKVKQIPQVTKYLKAIGAYVDITGEDIDILEVLSKTPDDAMGLLSVALDRPLEWVGELDLHEMSRAISVLIEVNSDFFIQAVLPGIIGLLEKVTAMVAKKRGGDTPSNS